MRKLWTPALGAMAAAALSGCGGETVDMANLANATDRSVVYEEEADLLGPPFDPEDAGGNLVPGGGSHANEATGRSSAHPE